MARYAIANAPYLIVRVFAMIDSINKRGRSTYLSYWEDRQITYSFPIFIARLPALVSIRLVNDKAENLALLDVIEAYNTDKAVGILRTAGLNFAQHFLSTSSAEQR